MVGALVGGAFLSASLQVLFDRIASREVVDFFRGKKLDQRLLNKLKITLLSVNSVLNDAEEKQITKVAVKKWLDELKDAVYDADDLIDQIATKALQSELNAETQTTSNQVSNLLSTFCNSSHQGLELKIEEILDTLEFLLKQKDALGLKEGVGEKRSRRLPSTSLVGESTVYGRDNDKYAIMKLLLCDNGSNKDICVIPIVGMGGVGKTTLAQLIYNDNKVKDYFDIKAWVCVSEEFDVPTLTSTILDVFSVTTSTTTDLNLLQVRLKERLTGKKFLLVLDDVWNENRFDWEVLRIPFSYGGQGSKIVVTTQSDRVATIMRTVPTYHLQQLLEEDCWLLFAKNAFDNGECSAFPMLEVIGRKIVKKCKGLPLAAKALGGLLRFKSSSEEWDRILNSHIWDFSEDESNILPALRLSYHHLPSHLKQCFAYCSIFPKDYKFVKHQLVQLWIAENFVEESKSNKRMEELGDEYFHDLVSRSFFQKSSGDESYFVMHDLLNDLSKCVSGEFSCSCDKMIISRRLRHMTYFRSNHDDITRFASCFAAKSLRTCLETDSQLQHLHFSWLSNKVLQDLLSTMKCLRVLSLSGYHNVTDLSDSIGNLIQLRYLDLSGTAIKRLPDSTCMLCNLQTLKLIDCRFLSELPGDMQKLVNLRHLDITGTNLIEMPIRMSRLKDLQTLTCFYVGKDSGSSIKELSQLSQLRGALSIFELQNVIPSTDALEANLKDKKYLEKLILKWSKNTNDSQTERDVLDKLRPHTNLKELTIEHYGGTQFPNWLGDELFSNIRFLCLSNCKYCFLPPFAQLPSLKELSIKGFDQVVTVGPEFYGSGLKLAPFKSLEILKFHDMMEWKEWHCFTDENEGGTFPVLQKLFVENCPKLTKDLPSELPSLIEVVISKCPLLVASVPKAPAACTMKLENCDKLLMKELPFVLKRLTVKGKVLESLPEDTMVCETCLEQLNVSECASLTCLTTSTLPTTLKTLEIRNCGNLELLMQQHCALLSNITIENCDSIRSFKLAYFPKLQYLSISKCRNFETISISERPLQGITSLNHLEIWHCPKLVSFPEGGLHMRDLSFCRIAHCQNLKSLPEQMESLLSSLRTLIIINCPELVSFPIGGLPSSLNDLSIYNSDKLIAGRTEWGLQILASLERFLISRVSEEVKSFPGEGLLPSTLTMLYLSKFSSLESLNGKALRHLTSLSELYIADCPKLQSLPEYGLPTSLLLLAVTNCPLLNKRCQREKGEDWPKIAHIRCIKIDEIIT